MLGLVTKMTDSAGVTNYTYDSFGRLTKEVKDGILKTYTYDGNNWYAWENKNAVLSEIPSSKISSLFGEFFKWDGNGSIRPNDFRVMVRETFSNQEITKSAARNSAIGTIGKKKPWYMSQNYYDQGQKYGKMLRDSCWE